MKKLYTNSAISLLLSLPFVVILALLPTTSFTQPLLTESFNYAPATLLTGANWTSLATGTPNITVSSGNLSYSGAIHNDFGNKVALTNNGQDVYRSFTSTNATVYSSLVVNVSGALATGDYFYALGYSTSLAYGAKLYIRSNGAGFSFGVLRGAVTGTPVYESTVRPFNTNIYLVLKYEVVTGATNDATKLYVNPSPLGTEPGVADATYSAAAGNDIAAANPLSSVSLTQGTAANAPTLQLDNINVGITWASVTTAQYDYGDLPATYEYTKDGVYAPAVHAPLANLSLGSVAPDLELAPASVAALADNNTPNGDGADEGAITIPAAGVRKGTIYNLQVPIVNNAAATRYLYGWLDFNNDGKFQLGEIANAVVSFSTTGSSSQTLTWSAAKTATLANGITKVYLRLRLSTLSLADFTTAGSGGDIIDERSVGNGAISTSNVADAATVAFGEVEDFQLDVTRTYEYGDLPLSFENDKDGNFLPALHTELGGFRMGGLLDVEAAPLSVISPNENNNDGDNENQVADEDGVADLNSVSRGADYVLTVAVTNPATSPTKYLYGWLDLNGDGRFQIGEVQTVTITTAGTTNQTLTWTTAQTNQITAGTKSIYLRLRLSDASLQDFSSGTGFAFIDERSLGNGATSTTVATNAPAAANGEVEDYQLRVDDYDFGDAPASYENGLPARHTALPSRHIGVLVDNETVGANVPAGTDNNNDNGDGADEDGLSGTLPVITKGAPFSFSVPATVSIASNIIAWIDFNNNDLFEASEAAYTLATGTSQAYQTVAIGTSTKIFWFRGTQTNTIPNGTNNVYVRIRLTQTAGADNTGTTAVDERSIGDGLGTGVYGAPTLGEVEDYRFAVVTDLDYGDAPVSYDMDKDGLVNPTNFKPARNYSTDALYMGQSYVLESGAASVASGVNNNAPNGDGDEEDGLAASQLLVRTNAVNTFNVAVNNTTGVAATLYAWIDLNNNGRFEAVSEFTSVNVPINATSVSISYSATLVNTIPSAATKVYMRLRLVQANAEAAFGDLTTGTNNAVVDERAIADGLSTGVYTSVALGEVEDYQLAIIKDFGDAPVSYESTDPASHSNASPIPELTIGATIDFEVANQPVTAGADNNGTNGDGADEDGITTPQTVTIGAPFTLTVPVNTTLTGTKYLYGWIDFNGDGVFNGSEVATTSVSVTAGTTGYLTLTWNGTQTGTATAVLGAGKTYARLRLSGVAITNSNAAGLIDTRSFGRNTDDGEIEDYQFLVSSLYDYGDAPASFEDNQTNVSLPARQAASSTLRLGATVDTESSVQSVGAGANNSGANGDGADEDGITNLAPIYSGIPYRTQVSVLNNTGAARTLYGWIDFDNNGRFTSGEISASLTVAPLATPQTVTLSWPLATITASNIYMRLRISEGTLADGAGGSVDERAIGDGLSGGTYGTLNGGEIEDYQLTVISSYDYGDAAPATYDQNLSNVSVPARQAISQGLYLGQLPADAEAAKQALGTTASGDDATGTDDEDGAVPGPVTPGASGYTLNVTATNNSGAPRTLYGWIDFNNNGRFEAINERASISVPNLTNNGIFSLTWTTAATATIPTVSTPDSLYMRLRISESAAFGDAANITLDEQSIGDGVNTGVNGTVANGEIEDYRIRVTTDLDYGDAPTSYDRPTGTLLPARHISSAALQIGGTPDAEPAPLSVAAGTDNNGTDGDGVDENGIVPANHPVTVNAAFTLPVAVTNTSGTARTLYGWLDINNNGIFEDNEVATTLPSVANNTNNGTVNLVWTAAVTNPIASPYVYLRLRLADATLVNNTGTAYDERSFADGLTTGIFGTATRGEVEDYRLLVNPAYDYGDIPTTFEANSSSINLPARHLPAATVYLGANYDTEVNAQSVVPAANNNTPNGDGADENGVVTPLTQLNPGGGYSVSVSVFKNIAGTGTIHAWIDMNGDGRFSSDEYTSTAVTAATGAQTATVNWPAVPYSGGATYTYMRLRFTTGTLTDNAATTTIDERSIGDGLSTGIYGAAPVNGEVEDYYVPVNLAGTEAQVAACTGLGSINAIQAGFHATLVRPAAGGYILFGELANGDGVTNITTPAKIETGSNGFNFKGQVRMATLGSTSAFTYHQYFLLTTAGLYAWGTRGTIVGTTVTSGTAMQPISLPPGVSPANIRMIDAGASYNTGGLVGDQTNTNGSLALLTTTGEVWIRSSVSAANITSEYNAVQGDGNLLTNNASTDWHQVEISAGVPLTGMLDVRTSGAAAMATNGTQFYTWGRNVFKGDGTAAAVQHYATLMTNPITISLPVNQVDMGFSGNISASYYLLDNQGVVHVLGNNNNGQLGIGDITAQPSWARITQKNEEPDGGTNETDVTSAMGRVLQLSTNNHDAHYGHLILITDNKRAYHAGSNAGGGGMSGTVAPTSFYIPTAMTTGSGASMLPGRIVIAEAGGHIGILGKEGSDRYGYVGHTVSGSDGCNGCTASPSEYNFESTTSTGPLCGIEAYDFGDLDDRYNLKDSAKHQILYAQVSNPLKLGITAADSDDGPTFTASGSSNNADGDDTDGDGDDEDAFAALPAKTTGAAYSVNVPLTNSTGSSARLYGFIDWDNSGTFTPNEAAATTVGSSASAQTITLTWPDPGIIAGSCVDALPIRSFVRLRLTTATLVDNTATPADERSHLVAADGEVEDYYLDWSPLPTQADLGNLPTQGSGTIWKQAKASLTALDLSATRIWLGDNNSYPIEGCVSNVARNGGLTISKSGMVVSGTGTTSLPFQLLVNQPVSNFEFNVTVNGNGASGTPVYYGIWFDVNGNGSFIDEVDVFRSGMYPHGSPATTTIAFQLPQISGGVTSGAVRIVVTAENTSFTKGQNGEVNVVNGEVEDYYVEYPVSVQITGSVFNDANGNTLFDGAENGNTLSTQLYVYLVNSNGIVVDSANVASDGTYTLQALPSQNYTLYLSQDQYAVGTNAALSPITNIPPTGWANAGENNGNTGTGDGNPNGILSVTVGTTGVASQNFGLIDRCSLLAPGSIDSDGDGVADRCDLDDDNDGILDTDENGCLNVAIATYPNGFLELKPSEFGISFTGAAQLGLNLTADLSNKFGYPVNSGKIIVHISNANVHPTADAFYVRGDLPLTDWEIGGSVGVATGVEHGMEFFAKQRREIRFYNYVAEVDNRVIVSNPTPASNWSTAVTNGVHYITNNTNNNYVAAGNGAILVAGTIKPDNKRFGIFTNDAGADRWSTYFVRILPECDADMDGIPNRLDKDSDNDGCMDAVEGGTGFTYADLKADGSLTGGVSATGIPTIAGTGQGIGTSQNAAQKAAACSIVIRGTVFPDANGNTVVGTGENFNPTTQLLPAPLYVYLVNSSGIVIDSAHVAADGSYTLDAGQNEDYTLHLSTVSYPIGTDTASTPIDRTPPAGWVNTGENLGNTGGGDLIPNGILAVSTTTSAVSNANFGIQHPPTAVNDQRLNNTYGSTVTINVLSNDTDLAPGNIVATTVTLIAPVTATNIVYDSPGGDIISMTIPGQGTWSVNETMGAITFTPQPGFVGNPTPIQYTVDDNAGFPSNPATVTVEYQNPISVSGNVFNDANGNTTADNGEEFGGTIALPVPLYMYLVNSAGMIMDSAHVAADGTYELQAAPNQAYTLKLSTVEYTVGASSAVATTPPVGWVTTGENGNGSSDGSPDGQLAITTASNNMINKNFGIERPPTANPVSWWVDGVTANVPYTLGTKDLNALGSDRYMNGMDTDDGSLTGGTPQSISLKITSLPDATYAKLYYDADGPGGNPSVEVTLGQEIPNYDPSKMSIVFVRSDIPLELTFTYDITDAAGVYSGAPATYTINRGTVLPATGLVLQGAVSNSQALLRWSTITEQGSSYFIVERSTDGGRFAEIGRVAASGNSNSRKDYTYNDVNLPYGGTTWYRVRLVGLDGDSRLSNTIGLTLQIASIIKIHPNPAKDFVTVRGLRATAELRLLDAAGKLLRVQREGGNTARVNLTGFASGMYLLQVIENGKLVMSAKVVKE